jgi:hypothetical protein
MDNLYPWYNNKYKAEYLKILNLFLQHGVLTMKRLHKLLGDHKGNKLTILRINTLKRRSYIVMVRDRTYKLTPYFIVNKNRLLEQFKEKHEVKL